MKPIVPCTIVKTSDDAPLSVSVHVSILKALAPMCAKGKTRVHYSRVWAFRQQGSDVVEVIATDCGCILRASFIAPDYLDTPFVCSIAPEDLSRTEMQEMTPSDDFADARYVAASHSLFERCDESTDGYRTAPFDPRYLAAIGKASKALGCNFLGIGVCDSAKHGAFIRAHACTDAAHGITFDAVAMSMRV